MLYGEHALKRVNDYNTRPEQPDKIHSRDVIS